MSTSTGNDDGVVHTSSAESQFPVVLAIPAAVVGCAIIATAAPIGVSIVAVFLLAGPHNWMEAQYFLQRMPARWGSLAPYFSLGLLGSLFLAGMFAALPWLVGDNSENSPVMVAIWNTLLTVWIVWLAILRSRQNPRREWPFLVPMGFALIAINWLSPLAWSLALVYLHPALALVFLDRELQRQPPVWRKSFRFGVLLIPLCLTFMAARWAGGPDVPGTDLLTWQITHHAGAGIAPQLSTHFLVAVHVFLELLHYMVWIIVIPWINRRNLLRWTLDVPLARRSPNWRRLVATVVSFGAVLMLLLWASFLTDYAWTRDVYFTVAILHVLMEIPFLLRSI